MARGRANARISAESIAAMVRESDGIDGVLDAIYAELDDNAWDNANPDMVEDSETIEMGDITSSDAENYNWEYRQNERERRQTLIAYLRTILPREQQEQLGIAP